MSAGSVRSNGTALCERSTNDAASARSAHAVTESSAFVSSNAGIERGRTMLVWKIPMLVKQRHEIFERRRRDLLVGRRPRPRCKLRILAHHFRMAMRARNSRAMRSNGAR